MTNLRETKRADELKPGDWIAAGPYNDRIDGTDDAEVLFVYQYASGGGQTVSVTIQEVTIQRPTIVDLHADADITLLTAEDIAGHRDHVARLRLAEELRDLADLVAAERIPKPPGMNITLSLKTRAEVEQIAVNLGLTPEDRYNDGLEVSWPPAKRNYEGGLYVEWYTAQKASEVEPESVAEHYEVRGWKGEGDGAGTCGVECACGVTYDGFDSLAEAAEFLARHIADPAGQDYGRADTVDEDDPTPTGPREPLHTGAMTEQGLIDVTSVDPVKPPHGTPERADWDSDHEFDHLDHTHES